MKWMKATLDEVADFCLGKMLDQKKNRGKLLPYLANINVRWGEFSFDGLRQMRFEDGELQRFGLKYGDIVMCEGGEPGRCAIWKSQVPGMMLQKALHRIRPHKCLDYTFLYYVFLHYGQTRRFSPLFTGSTINHLPREKLALLELNIPPLPTQRKIAGILSAYDDLIENNTRRIAILEQMAQAIYREWFVEFRFPGHENVKLVDSALGKIPEGWEVKQLSAIAEVNALSIRKGEEPDEIHYVDIASVSTGKIDEIRSLLFSDAPGRAKRVLRHGDVIWSTVRPNRKSYSLVLSPSQNMIGSTGFAVISGTSAPFSYVYHALTTDDFVGYLVNHATGSAYPAVNSSDFENALILVPSGAVLSEFHKITEGLLLSKHCLLKKNEKLRQTRDILLPKLISGELDVEELDIETGELELESE